MELIIKNSRGVFVVLYDECDHDFISSRNWYIKSGMHPYPMTSYRVDGFRYSKKEYLHRMILNLKDPLICCDHINRNPLDSRRCNLRLATKSQNNINKDGYGTSKYRGVYFNKEKKKWQAAIKINGKYKNIGRFINEIDAAKKYNEYSLKHNGEFAYINQLL